MLQILCGTWPIKYGQREWFGKETMSIQMKRKIIYLGSVMFIFLLAACGQSEMRANNNNILESDKALEENALTTELRKSEEGNRSVRLEKVPFEVELRDDQFVTVCDIRNFRILCYVWHWNESYAFALTDEILVWNMNTHEIERTIDMKQEYLFSAVLDDDGGICLSCADVNDCKGEKWELRYLKNGTEKFTVLKKETSTLEAGWGSSWLVHFGNQVAGICEKEAEG